MNERSSINNFENIKLLKLIVILWAYSNSSLITYFIFEHWQNFFCFLFFMKGEKYRLLVAIKKSDCLTFNLSITFKTRRLTTDFVSFYLILNFEYLYNYSKSYLHCLNDKFE